ncbi:MAG: hypothetical protein P8Y42_10595, partial [Exilibacterium sp.]
NDDDAPPPSEDQTALESQIETLQQALENSKNVWKTWKNSKSCFSTWKSSGSKHENRLGDTMSNCRL